MVLDGKDWSVQAKDNARTTNVSMILVDPSIKNRCDPPFTGPLCTLLQCSLIIRPNSTHTLIHLSMDMIIDYNDHYDYDTNDKDYETISRLQKEEREYQQAWFKICMKYCGGVRD